MRGPAPRFASASSIFSYHFVLHPHSINIAIYQASYFVKDAYTVTLTTCAETRALKTTDRPSVKLASEPRTKSTCRLSNFQLCLHRKIALRWYWKRPRPYQKARYSSSIDYLLSSSMRELKFLFQHEPA
jgi:hypothetical protein